MLTYANWIMTVYEENETTGLYEPTLLGVVEATFLSIISLPIDILAMPLEIIAFIAYKILEKKR